MSEGLMPPNPPPPDDVFVPFTFEKYRKITLEKDFLPFVSGKIELPNFKPIEHWEALRNSMGYGRTVERYDVKERYSNYTRQCQALVNGSKGDAIFYMNCGPGGGYTGEGTVVMRHGWNPGPDSIVTGKFALCEHVKVEGPGANHSRGWHPGWCEKCGMDMSVDSGD